MCVLVTAAAAAETAIRRSSYRAAPAPPLKQQNRSAGQSDNQAASDRLSRASLWPQLRPALDAIGDRLERRGKERIMFAGTPSRGDGGATIPFVLVGEFPGRLRLEEADERGRRVVAYDAGRVGAVSAREESGAGARRARRPHA